MIRILIDVIKHTPLNNLYHNLSNKRNQKKVIKEWERNGRAVPPPHVVKQHTLLNYAKKYNLKVLVETGTYYGDMVNALKDNFKYIYSIEIGKDLYEQAKKRFENACNVELILGDSGRELKRVMEKLDRPALFWLDGHYSAGVTARGIKDTPIYEELNHIFSRQDEGHVIIIDDARCFGTNPAYPTIDELKEFIYSNRKDMKIFIQDDSIRITPISSYRV